MADAPRAAPTMSVIGFDVSLNSTGWARLAYDTGDLIDCGTIVTDPADSLMRRLRALRDGVLAVLADGCDVAIEEGISHRSGAVTRKLAMAWYVVADAVWDRLGVEPATVNVATVKRTATSNGSARKAQVMAAAVLRWGPDADHPDIADAAWVAECARRDLHRQFPEPPEAA